MWNKQRMDSAPLLKLTFNLFISFVSKFLYLFSHNSTSQTYNTSSQLTSMPVGIGVDQGSCTVLVKSHHVETHAHGALPLAFSLWTFVSRLLSHDFHLHHLPVEISFHHLTLLWNRYIQNSLKEYPFDLLFNSYLESFLPALNMKIRKEWVWNMSFLPCFLSDSAFLW